ncbi:hypothetical protein ACWEJ6_16110, partial [Nonomuraea sp. NPDC004702]
APLIGMAILIFVIVNANILAQRVAEPLCLAYTSSRYAARRAARGEGVWICSFSSSRWRWP